MPKLTWVTATIAAVIAAALIAPATAAPDPAAELSASTAELLPPKILTVDGASGGVELLDRLLRVPAASDDSDASADRENQKNSCKIIGPNERRFSEKINKARTRRNVRKVSLDREISAVAAVHARAMKRQANLYHTPDRKLRERVTRWILLGENVGRGMNTDSLHRAFMESRGHRKTVTHKRFRHVGVGIARDQDQIWITVLFESRNDPGTRIRLPKGC